MSSDAVAIFLDEEELGQLIADWPADMRLAVCLDEGGGCAMVVHHRAEDDADGRILRRIGEALGRRPGEFSVVPARPGQPTRKMMFSEERMLMSLVAESEELQESASDYALNYAFAAEEGLDIEAIVSGQARAAAPSRLTPVTPEPETPQVAPQPPAAKDRAAVEDDLTLAEPPAPYHLALPGGFRALAPEEQHYSLFTDAVLSLGRSGQVRLISGETTPEDAGSEIGELYFRDDLLSFAIPISALVGCERLPAKIVFDEGLLPRALVAALERGPQAVRLTATGAYLFIGLAPARLPATEPKTPDPKTPAKRRRSLAGRILRGGIGGGTIAAGILLVLQLGLAPAFSHTETKPSPTSLRDQIFARNGH